jgi:hypothetical protein
MSVTEEGIETEQVLSIMSMYCEQSDFDISVLYESPLKASNIQSNIKEESDDDEEEDPTYHMVSDAILIIHDSPKGQDKKVYPLSEDLDTTILLNELQSFVEQNTNLMARNKLGFLLVSEQPTTLGDLL